MKISRDEVRRVAALACLEFDADGESRMAGEMSRILDYVDQIRSVTIGADDTAAERLPVRLRDDVAAESLSVSLVEQAAPRFARGHFVVPKVIGGE